MLTRRLGASGLAVSRLGLGTMAWGPAPPPRTPRDLLATFRAAGGTLVDTAHGYAGGAAEEIIGDLSPVPTATRSSSSRSRASAGPPAPASSTARAGR